MKTVTRSVSPTPIPQEPWVKISDGLELMTWDRDEEIVYNQANRQTQKLAFFVNAFDFLSANKIEGDYHEYGCHRGRTFRMALTEARRHNFDTMQFFAFDSFDGLPDVSRPPLPEWQRGALCTTEAQFRQLIQDHGIYVERCHFIKGFFQTALTTPLQRTFISNRQRIAFTCIDCDLYESAVSVFRFIEPLLQQGTLLYLDDYFVGYQGSPLKGVAGAFHQFERISRFTFIPHMQVGWWGRSFIAYRDEGARIKRNPKRKPIGKLQ